MWRLDLLTDLDLKVKVSVACLRGVTVGPRYLGFRVLRVAWMGSEIYLRMAPIEFAAKVSRAGLLTVFSRLLISLPFRRNHAILRSERFVMVLLARDAGDSLRLLMKMALPRRSSACSPDGDPKVQTRGVCCALLLLACAKSRGR